MSESFQGLLLFSGVESHESFCLKRLRSRKLQKELVQSFGLLASASDTPLTGAAETRAAEAFSAFRRAMQRDLIDIAATCGV